jgi:hypothetical protein
MKKYLAFHGSINSGIQTKDKAHDWAAQQLAVNSKIDKVYVAEVVETCERTTPTIETKQFFCELNEPITKAA